VTAAFDALGDATRRRLLELLAPGEQAVGALVTALQERAPITQPTVSQHLRVLREAGLVTVRADGTSRFYAIAPTGVAAATAWLETLTNPLAPFEQPLDALATEVARGKRERRTASKDTAATRRRTRSA
jgi:DNA-binding transcriptional ArsR family regulator